MPAQVFIRIEGLERIRGKLRDLEPRQYMMGVMGECVSDVKDDIAAVPGPSHQPVIWPSAAYRAWYLGARRAEGLPIPYSRETDPWSETLIGGWTTRVEQGGMRGVVGNRASYGPFVQDAPRQMAQHKATGWKTIQQTAKDMAPKVIKKVQEAVERILRR